MPASSIVPPSLTVAPAARPVAAARMAVIRERTRRDAGERMDTRIKGHFRYCSRLSSTSRSRDMFGAGTLFFSGELRQHITGFHRESITARLTGKEQNRNMFSASLLSG